MAIQIKKISKVKNFGVFGNFRWPTDLPEFTFKNVIYGWNYSGKTTFSRILQSLERKAIHPDFSAAEFEIVLDEGSTITEKNLKDITFPVRVFNSDFVKNNFHWDESNIEPILLLGEKSIATQQAIETKEAEVIALKTKSVSTRKNAQKIIDSLNERKKELATRLTRELSLGRNFNRTNVEKIIVELGGKLTESVIHDNSVLRSTLQQATAKPEDLLKDLSIEKPIIQLPELYQQTKILIEFSPGLTKVIDHLEKNKKIADWVELGLDIHEVSGTCEFCGEHLSEARITELRGHFSKEYLLHKEKLKTHLTALKAAKLPDINLRSGDFYPQFRKEFVSILESTTSRIKNYNDKIQRLISVTEEKFDNPFTIPKDFSNVSNLQPDELLEYKNLQELIKKHNSASTEFEKRKIDAIAAMKNHNVALFANDVSLISKTIEHGNLVAQADQLREQANLLKNEIISLRAQINSSEKGKQVLNDFIWKFLGKDSIKIDITTDESGERFVLKRGDSFAKNLSEGEKTALAFSHFLVKLAEIQNFSDAIICIDDPISSLDNNHIFQVTSILKDHLFEYVPQVSNPSNSEWKLRCAQLFLSTHSFEFLGLLKEVPTKNFNTFHPTKGKTVFYMLQVDQEAACKISKLPNSLRQTETEYHYLFSLLEDFSKSTDWGNHDNLMILPNAFRRFVELYTYSKIPRPIAVDQRAEKIFGIESSKRILKVLHYFSHARFDRINKHSDLICDLGDAVKELLEAIERIDKDHIDALRQVEA